MLETIEKEIFEGEKSEIEEKPTTTPESVQKEAIKREFQTTKVRLQEAISELYANTSEDNIEHEMDLDHIAAIRIDVIRKFDLVSYGFEGDNGGGAEYQLSIEGNNLVVGGDKNEKEFIINSEGEITIR